MAKDHFVSQFYLKRFGFPSQYDKEMFETFVYDIWAEKLKRKAVHNIAFRKNLFPEHIEKWFSYFESLANTFLRKVDRNVLAIQENRLFTEPHDDIDKFVIKKLVEFQIRRSISAQQNTEIWVKKSWEELVKRLWNLNLVNFSLSDLSTILSQSLYQRTVESFTRPFFTWKTSDWWENIDTFLSKRQWLILYVKKNVQASFISCDFPLTALNPNWPNGLRYDTTELYFPLSPNILLVNLKWKYPWGIEYGEISDRSFIKLINKLITANANQLLFSSSEKLLNTFVSYYHSPTRNFKQWLPSDINSRIDIEDLYQSSVELLRKHWRIAE